MHSQYYKNLPWLPPKYYYDKGQHKLMQEVKITAEITGSAFGKCSFNSILSSKLVAIVLAQIT